jgi:hypothetical protein
MTILRRRKKKFEEGLCRKINKFIYIFINIKMKNKEITESEEESEYEEEEEQSEEEDVEIEKVDDGEAEEEEGEEEESEGEEDEESESEVVEIDFGNEELDMNQSLKKTHGRKIQKENEQLKKLLALDPSSISKEELVEMLLQCEAFHPKTLEQDLKKKNNNRFKNVQSHYNAEKLKSLNDTKNKFHVTPNKNDPEFTNDFGTACIKVFAKMSENQENKDLLNLLVSDKEVLRSELTKLDINRKYIENKINSYVQQREKKLHDIAMKMEEDFETKCTFAPVLVAERQIQSRNLEEFLQSQKNHEKRIEDKVRAQKEDQIKKEQPGNPKIDPNSQKIYDARIKTEEPTFMRLYKKRFNNEKKNVLGGSEVKANKKVKDKKQNEQHINNLYQKGVSKQSRLEELKEKFISEEKKENKLCWESNKYMLKNFTTKYRDSVIKLINNTDNTKNKLNENNLLEILTELGFIKYISKGDSSKNKFGQDEKKLFKELFEELKDSENLISAEDLFMFLLNIVNLYKYHLYACKQHAGETKNIDEVINSLKSELENKIIRHSKFGGFDVNGNFLVGFDKAGHINKEFKLFYINFMESDIVKTKKQAQAIENSSFKPTINPYSEKICNEFRRRYHDPEDGQTRQSLQIDYFEKVLNKKKLKEMYI